MSRFTGMRMISSLRNLMVGLNYLIVMFYSSVFLLATRFIVNHQKSNLFLSEIDHIPKNPVTIFFACLFLYAVLAALILSRSVSEISEKAANLTSIILEIILGFQIVYYLNMAYSGLFLMVFSDCLFHMRREKNTTSYSVLGILACLYFLSNYYVVSFFFPMADPAAYFNVFDHSLSSLLIMLKNLLEMINLLIFVAYLSLYINHQTKENENIAQELNMINQVNRELKNYAAITERIGENNERKRLAREIHDTLGHALTGIAAGVDATLIIIDKSPDLAKKQLHLVSQVVREGISDVRNSLNKLRPGALEQSGLKGALQKMITEFIGLSDDLQIDLNYEVENIDFEVAKEDALFRVVQESITNSIRHGAANHIQIHFYIADENLNIIIDDNGFGAHCIEPGYGLTQMKERIAAIHGIIHFDGSDGFTTRIQVPLQKGEFHD